MYPVCSCAGKGVRTIYWKNSSDPFSDSILYQGRLPTERAPWLKGFYKNHPLSQSSICALRESRQCHSVLTPFLSRIVRRSLTYLLPIWGVL
jgi:hypothetical protein